MTTNIKEFNRTKQNIATDEEFSTVAESGFIAGVAKSKEFNKANRQSALIAAAVAKYLDDNVSGDILDTMTHEDIAALVPTAIAAKFVRHDANQSLTTPQKAQARSNIGSISSDDDITGNSATASAAKSGSALETAINNKLSLAGGTMTGAIYGRMNTGTTIADPNTNSGTSMVIVGNATASASMSFVRNNIYAVNLGLDTDNKFKVGGWSRVAAYEVLDGGNYLDYAMPKPQTTEVGAISWMYGVISAYVVGTKISGSQITLSDSERSHAASGFFDGRPFSTPGTWELIAWRGTSNGDAKLLKRVN